MSSGSFVDTFYKTDDDEILNITLQPETLELQIGAVANNAPAGPSTSDAPVNVSRGRGVKGISARKIRVRITNPGTSRLAAGSIISLPWLDPDTFTDVTRPGRQTGTYYLGSTVQVVGGTAESYKVR